MIEHMRRLGRAVLLTCCTIAGATALGQWTQPQPLNSYASRDVGYLNNTPDVATNGVGNWVTIWRDVDGLFAAHSSDVGASWSSPVSIDIEGVPAVPYPGSTAAVSYAGGNVWVVLWLIPGADESANVTYMSRSLDNGQTWSSRTAVSTGPMESAFDLVSDKNGTLLFYSYSRILRSTDSGQTWAATQVPVAPGNTRNSRIASAGNNKWLMAISAYTGDYTDAPGSVFAFLSVDNGATWGNEKLVYTGATRFHSITVGDVGAVGNNLAIVALSHRDEFPDLKIIASVNGGGAWADVSATGEQQKVGRNSSVAIASSGIGKWTIVGNRRSGGLYTPQEIVWTRTETFPTGWTNLAVVSGNPAAFQLLSAIASDDNGDIVAVYNTNANSLQDLEAVHSTDHAATWSNPVYADTTTLDKAPRFDDEDVNLSVADNGTMMAIWRATQSSPADIHIARSINNGVSWEAARAISAGVGGNGERLYPEAIANGSGRWTAIWTSSFVYYFTNSFDDGLTWSTPEPLNATAYGANGSGTFILSRYMSTGNYAIYRSGDAGLTWSAPFMILPQPGAIVHSSGSNWFLFSTNNEFFTSADDGLTWTKRVSTNVPQRDSMIISDHKGKVVAAYSERQPPRDEFFVKISRDNGISWSPARPVNSFNNDLGYSYSAFLYDVEFASHGRLVAVWPEHVPLAGGSDPDFFTGEYIVKMSISSNDGISWTPPRDVADKGYYLQSPSLAIAAGNVFVAWEERNAQDAVGNPYGDDYDIFYSTSRMPGPASAQDWQLYE